MKVPSPEQATWARAAWLRVTETYHEFSSDGFRDFSPMLALIEHIGRFGHAEFLSAGTSLHHLIVASAAHATAPNRLADNAPAICITQLETEFQFRDAKGRRRNCPFDCATEVFDAHLVRLSIQADDYDRRATR